MGPFSYESGFHATQKAVEQCFFSSTFCPQDCPQLVPPMNVFGLFLPRPEGLSSPVMHALLDRVWRMIEPNDYRSASRMAIEYTD
jgi:hypothetical protein